tara:strand:- start:1595 stop:3028 length:1434 start_codon:yes stop_codon:yes gene_type:complete
MKYDYTIIGGGPSGIYCADKLSQLGYKVCLVESLETLGGCHRVRYIENTKTDKTHTEHGPRIYLGCYLDFWKWIEEINVSLKDFEVYKFDMLSKDFFDFISNYNPKELFHFILSYINYCILGINLTDKYTVQDFIKDNNFSEKGSKSLNRVCRLIDGGNIDKTLLKSLLNGIDVGLVYKIYEPTDSMDELIWNKFYNKLLNQNVEILLNTPVKEINIGRVITDTNSIDTDNIILTIPPYALNNIKNAPLLCGYEPDIFDELSKYQQYEPYICATIQFENFSPKEEWGIANEHPWGMIAIDMGRYIKKISGSMFIVSITHPEKIDPEVNKSANDMEKEEFLNRVVSLVKTRFKIKDNPIKKTFSPNVKKINGKWIEYDRAFMYSPPGWLKPDINISKKNKVYTTGHHIGESYHEYNSMESAIQNASKLLSIIDTRYNYQITKPYSLSFFIWILIILIISFILYNKRKYAKKIYKKYII